jgi:thiosulfate/3-mercaptopyruvate sulfurtransferase
MRHAGVCDGRPVVVYDQSDSLAGARAWWLLRYYGHQQVRVLDGGYRAWMAAGQPSQQAASAAAPGDFHARPGHMPLLSAAEAAALGRSGRLLDARAGERYRGDAEPIDPVAGHIPGALSVPATGNVTEDGHLLSQADLRERFAAAGLPADPATGLGAYCGSGVTAAHAVLALSIAGIPASLYAGSWSHWITDPGRPVASGPDPG